MDTKRYSDTNIRVMTANIWGNCGKNIIANRDDNSAVVFLRYLPDSIGLQEVSTKYREEENNLFKLVCGEYTEVPAEVIKPFGTSQGKVIGEDKCNFTPIIYRSAALTLVDCGFHNYKGLNDHGSKSITWAVFERKSDKKRYVHLNTHFYWTSDEAGEAARMNNVDEMFAVVSKLEGVYGQLPLFATGDFNCVPHSRPWEKIVAGGMLETQMSASVSTSTVKSHHPYPEFDEAAQIFKNGPMPTGEQEKSIDHIFTLGGAAVYTHNTVTDREALDSSDHCPVFVDADI